MTTKPKIIIHDSETGEVVEREMTEIEAANYEQMKEKHLTEQNAIETAKANAAAKLEALGLTADDLKALGL